jgi:hypothetical protein
MVKNCKRPVNYNAVPTYEPIIIICPASFRETCQWLKFPLNGLRAQSRVSPVVGLLLKSKFTIVLVRFMKACSDSKGITPHS